jgi:hypothetical protein
MPKKLRPAVDLMAFKCRTLKVNTLTSAYHIWRQYSLIIQSNRIAVQHTSYQGSHQTDGFIFIGWSKFAKEDAKFTSTYERINEQNYVKIY